MTVRHYAANGSAWEFLRRRAHHLRWMRGKITAGFWRAPAGWMTASRGSENGRPINPTYHKIISGRAEPIENWLTCAIFVSHCPLVRPSKSRCVPCLVAVMVVTLHVSKPPSITYCLFVDAEKAAPIANARATAWSRAGREFQSKVERLPAAPVGPLAPLPCVSGCSCP